MSENLTNEEMDVAKEAFLSAPYVRIGVAKAVEAVLDLRASKANPKPTKQAKTADTGATGEKEKADD